MPARTTADELTGLTPDLANTDEPPRGAFYVGARVVGVPDLPRPDGAVRVCIACGEDVWVAADDVALALSCAAVMCSDCTGTAEGILYIAP